MNRQPSASHSSSRWLATLLTVGTALLVLGGCAHLPRDPISADIDRHVRATEAECTFSSLDDLSENIFRCLIAYSSFSNALEDIARRGTIEGQLNRHVVLETALAAVTLQKYEHMQSEDAVRSVRDSTKVILSFNEARSRDSPFTRAAYRPTDSCPIRKDILVAPSPTGWARSVLGDAPRTSIGQRNFLYPNCLLSAFTAEELADAEEEGDLLASYAIAVSELDNGCLNLQENLQRLTTAFHGRRPPTAIPNDRGFPVPEAFYFAAYAAYFCAGDRAAAALYAESAMDGGVSAAELIYLISVDPTQVYSER